MAVNTNTYCHVDEIKDALGISDDTNDARIVDVMRTASRLIDAECDTIFYDSGSATARSYVAKTPYLVEVHDFSTTDGLVVKTDPTFDGTFETTWTSSDYQVEPLNGWRGGIEVSYNQLRAVGGLSFPCSGNEPGVQITAQWGWATVPDPVREACVIQAVSIMKAPEAPLGVAGYGDFGPVRLRQQLHPMAAMLLKDYAVDVFPVM